ncbi:hypothetical protein AB1Y20_004346 [Prymnesium parvum]|uniref:Uncharacterized protein n=1 Tax=Prymnesium parvum TaxID=97485 RepID=A0AB34IXD7_PRYPA
MAAGRALLLSLEWALDRADPELVRSLDAQMDSLSISLGGNTAIRTRRLLFWLKCFSTTGGDFTQASQWLEELRGLLRWREEGIEREYIAVRLAIRTQLVLQHLTSGGDSWKAAKRALERCFPSEGASRGPSDGDERARYYSLDSAIRAAQRRETQRVVSTRERHPEAAVLEQVHAFVRQVKRLLRPPALLLLDAEGRLAREPVGAPADQAHCACSGHAHSRGNASPRASPPLHSIANDHAAPAPPMPPSAAPPTLSQRAVRQLQSRCLLRMAHIYLSKPILLDPKLHWATA